MKSLRGLVLAGVAGVGGCGVGGCASYRAPELAVSDVRLAEHTAAGYVVEFTLAAANYNEVELPLRQARYSVEIDGERVFAGVRSPEATLRRLGTQRITLPAAAPLGPGELPPRGRVRYRIEGELGYTTPGQMARVLFDLGVRRPTVGFAEEGEAELGVAR